MELLKYFQMDLVFCGHLKPIICRDQMISIFRPVKFGDLVSGRVIRFMGKSVLPKTENGTLLCSRSIRLMRTTQRALSIALTLIT